MLSVLRVLMSTWGLEAARLQGGSGQQKEEALLRAGAFSATPPPRPPGRGEGLATSDLVRHSEVVKPP